MRHPDSGREVLVPIGFSPAVFLFGPLVWLVRRNWVLAATCVLLPLVGQVALAYCGDRLQVRGLVRKGYRAVGDEPGDITRKERMLRMSLPRYRERSRSDSDSMQPWY